MADVTISQLNQVAATGNSVIPISQQGTTYQASVSSIVDTIGSRTSSLALPAGTTEQRPTGVPGAIRYNTTSKLLEWFSPDNGWVTFTGPVDSGNGQGLATWQGAIGSNITGATNSSQLKYWINLQNQPGSYIDYFNYSCNGSGLFAMHTGHQPGWWPEFLAVRVTEFTPRVLNQVEWLKHSNAVGNVDIYGSNQSIDSSNYTDFNLYTNLGRIHCGGSGSDTDCTLITRSFNLNNFGYRWYMFNMVDTNTSALPYPQQGTKTGWAMYGMRLNKVTT